MRLQKKLDFIWRTTTLPLLDDTEGEYASDEPLAPNRRYVAASSPSEDDSTWCVYDRFEERFLNKRELRALPPRDLTQEIAAC